MAWCLAKYREKFTFTCVVELEDLSDPQTLQMSVRNPNTGIPKS
jgi:hypothetical protein